MSGCLLRDTVWRGSRWQELGEEGSCGCTVTLPPLPELFCNGSLTMGEQMKRGDSRSGSNRNPFVYHPIALSLGHLGSHDTALSVDCKINADGLKG